MKLLLDEMLDPAIAGQLRERGHDAAAATDGDRLRGASDRQVLAVATSGGRAIVTYDIADFLKLDQELRGAGRAHAGLVLLSHDRFPQRDPRTTGHLVTALDTLATKDPPWPGFAVWLESP